MKKYLLFLVLGVGALPLEAQINCNLFKWAGDSVCYRACQIYDFSNNAYQGSRASQILYDSVIAICPSFDLAYMEKAVPYLKRGDFANWRYLMDQAVSLNPAEHLGYRGWCRYQFLRDYTGALEDIDALEKLKPTNMGYSVNGDYHLKIAQALCHKGLGNKQKAISIIEQQLATEGYEPGYYDYLHLAVLYLETGQPAKSLPLLEKQRRLSASFAETHYYLAKAWFMLHIEPEKRQQELQKALDLYQTGRHRSDPYTHPDDRIYLEDIRSAMEKW
jgi:tetratricopeptide (TPR) repeat protein